MDSQREELERSRREWAETQMMKQTERLGLVLDAVDRLCEIEKLSLEVNQQILTYLKGEH